MKSEKIENTEESEEKINSPNTPNGHGKEEQQQDLMELTEEQFRKGVQSTLVSINQTLAAVAGEFKKIRATQEDLTQFRDALMEQMKNAKQGNNHQSNGQQPQPNGNGESLSKDEIGGVLKGLVDVGKELGIVGKNDDMTLPQFFMQMGMKQFESMANLNDAITQSILKNGIGGTVGKEIGASRKFADTEARELK